MLGDKIIYIEENIVLGNEIFKMIVNYDNGGIFVYILILIRVFEYIELVVNGN